MTIGEAKAAFYHRIPVSYEGTIYPYIQAMRYQQHEPEPIIQLEGSADDPKPGKIYYVHTGAWAGEGNGKQADGVDKLSGSVRQPGAAADRGRACREKERPVHREGGNLMKKGHKKQPAPRPTKDNASCQKTRQDYTCLLF